MIFLMTILFLSIGLFFCLFFVKCSSIWVFLFPHYKIEVMHFWQESRKNAYGPSPRGGMRWRHVSLLVWLVWVIWLRWYLPGFSAVKLLISVGAFSRYFVWDNSGLFKILFLIILWPTNIRIHPWLVCATTSPLLLRKGDFLFLSYILSAFIIQTPA